MMESFKKLFTSKGRAGRLEYLRFLVLFVIIIFTVAVAAAFIVGFCNLSTKKASILFSFLMLPLVSLVILSFILTIRRLHDINYSGWWLLLRIIPFVGGLLLELVLCFKKGTEGPNKYGEAPKEIKHKLLIIIAAIIIAIILTITTIFSAIYKGPNLDSSDINTIKIMAEKGDATAQNNLGVAYLDGKEIPQDYAKAFKYLKLAAEQGNANAQNNLGNFYTNGEGVAQDFAKAFKWFKLAAEQGHSDAQYDLGRAYAQGWGVIKNDAEAIKWLKLAADQGMPEAKAALKELEK